MFSQAAITCIKNVFLNWFSIFLFSPFGNGNSHFGIGSILRRLQFNELLYLYFIRCSASTYIRASVQVHRWLCSRIVDGWCKHFILIICCLKSINLELFDDSLCFCVRLLTEQAPRDPIPSPVNLLCFRVRRSTLTTLTLSFDMLPNEFKKVWSFFDVLSTFFLPRFKFERHIFWVLNRATRRF